MTRTLLIVFAASFVAIVAGYGLRPRWNGNRNRRYYSDVSKRVRAQHDRQDDKQKARVL